MPRKLPIFYNALLLTGVNLLLRFVSTSFQVYLTGRVGAAGIGLLQLVLSVGSMAMTAGMAGIRTASMYLTAEELGKGRPQNVTWVLSACFLYSITISFTVSTALRFLAPLLAEKWIGDPSVEDAIRLYACFVPVCCLCGVMVGYFTAANRIGTLAAVEIAEQVLYMAVTMGVLLLWAGNDPAKACQSVILGSGISSCMTLGALTLLRLRERPRNAPPFPIRKRLLETAVPLALADDLRTGISTTENLMVPKRLALFSGAIDPLAAFGTVCGMVFPVLMFPAAILFGLAELLIPELARCHAAGSHRRTEYLTRRSLRLAMLYGCLFCGLEYLLAEPLCTALYQTPEAGIQLRRYALLIPILYCDAITDAMTKGLGQQKACVRYNILTSAMDVAFLYLLLPKYGMGGYFFSFFITHLLNFLLSLRRLLITANITVGVKPILFTGLATAAGILICRIIGSPVAAGICFPVIYFSLLVLLQVIGMEDLGWLRGLVLQKK
ncbi:MAG: oligosaccharide flippase family protein [Oscillospiraceae bacterium]|nr:oligosaccharide flippase family protein [Oscillospiraceae bacterium]